MRKIIIAAIAASAVAAPAVAFGHDGRGHGDRARMANFEFSGVVAAAPSDGTFVVSPVRARSRHAFRALAGAQSFTVKLGPATRVIVRGTAEESHFGMGSPADIHAGDRVKIVIRAPRGTALADLPAARSVRVMHHGSPTTPPSDPPPPPPPAGGGGNLPPLPGDPGTLPPLPGAPAGLPPLPGSGGALPPLPF